MYSPKSLLYRYCPCLHDKNAYPTTILIVMSAIFKKGEFQQRYRLKTLMLDNLLL